MKKKDPNNDGYRNALHASLGEALMREEREEIERVNGVGVLKYLLLSKNPVNESELVKAYGSKAVVKLTGNGMIKSIDSLAEPRYAITLIGKRWFSDILYEDELCRLCSDQRFPPGIPSNM